MTDKKKKLDRRRFVTAGSLASLAAAAAVVGSNSAAQACGAGSVSFKTDKDPDMFFLTDLPLVYVSGAVAGEADSIVAIALMLAGAAEQVPEAIAKIDMKTVDASDVARALTEL